MLIGKDNCISIEHMKLISINDMHLALFCEFYPQYSHYKEPLAQWHNIKVRGINNSQLAVKQK